MKSIAAVIALATISVPTFAACPSIDKAIEDMRTGRGSMVEVNNAIACQAPSCDYKITALTNAVVSSVAKLDIGEGTNTEILAAARSLYDAKVECAK